MPKDQVSLLIIEPGATRARYVEVQHVPFTLGNAANADVPVKSGETKVRVRVVKRKGGYLAQNLSGTKPGQPIRSLPLENKTKLRTGGVLLQFFTTPMSSQLVKNRIDALSATFGSSARARPMRVTQKKSSSRKTASIPIHETAPDVHPATALEAQVIKEEDIYIVLDFEETLFAPDDSSTENRPGRLRVEINRFKARCELPTLPASMDNSTCLHASQRARVNTEELLAKAKDLIMRLDQLSQKIEDLPDFKNRSPELESDTRAA